LTPEENSLQIGIMKVLEDHQNLDYLMASLKGDASTLYHEYAHARFHLDDSLKAMAQDMYNTLPLQIRKTVDLELKMRGYQESVFVDEFQAYLLESPEDFGRRWGPQLRPMHDQLRKKIPKPDLKNEINWSISGRSYD
jgi:hypothetical protein